MPVCIYGNLLPAVPSILFVGIYNIDSRWYLTRRATYCSCAGTRRNFGYGPSFTVSYCSMPCPHQVVPGTQQHCVGCLKHLKRVLPCLGPASTWSHLEPHGHFNVKLNMRGSVCSLSQSMVMQKKLRKAISYVARVQSFSFSGPASKGTMDYRLLKWFRTIPGVGSQVSATMTDYSPPSCFYQQCDSKIPCFGLRLGLGVG